MSSTTFRNHLASALDKVNADHEPVLVTRRNGASAVVISLEDFKSYEETAWLMASAANARRLHQAMDELERGKGVERQLSET